MKRKNGDFLKFSLLAAVFLLAFFGSFLLGRYHVSPWESIQILISRILARVSGGKWELAQTWNPTQASAVLNVRFPRIASAALVGAALSVAGVSFQGMFRNPMVSPDLLGASTGAGFGAALAILMELSYFAITLSAFCFGLLAVALAYVVGRRGKLHTGLGMVLAGVMVSSLFSSGTSFIKLVADTDSQLPAITYWLMGSLSSVKRRDLWFAAIPILLGIVPLLFLRWRMNLLTLSEAEARSMGVNTNLLRFIVILCATLMTAGSVSISGMIGWVGLVIPHFCRMMFGYDYRRLLPASALMGASFLMIVDDLARILTTSEIPLGILTSFVGAPLFLYLILTGGVQRAN